MGRELQGQSDDGGPTEEACDAHFFCGGKLSVRATLRRQNLLMCDEGTQGK